MKKEQKQLQCPDCKMKGIKNFKIRTNYPYGVKSKGRTTVTCKRCGCILPR